MSILQFFSAVVVVTCLSTSCGKQAVVDEPVHTYEDHNETFIKGVNIADDYPDYTSEECQLLTRELRDSGLNWVAITPCGSVTSPWSTEVFWSGWGKRDYVTAIQLSIAEGMHVFLKPYLFSGHFFSHGTWTGTIAIEDPVLRSQWFDSYRAFIMDNARYAEAGGANMLAIGMELPQMSGYTDAWLNIIDSVRSVYSGDLTYCAHGIKEAEEIEFWDKLDVVCVNLYPTLTAEREVADSALVAGWNKLKPRLRRLSEELERNIVISELGFRSVERAAYKPWEWAEHSERVADMEAQRQAYAATAKALYNEPWLGGVFWWKVFTAPTEQPNHDVTFSPQNKPAFEQMIRDFQER